jgi:hypothetical protein
LRAEDGGLADERRLASPTAISAAAADAAATMAASPALLLPPTGVCTRPPASTSRLPLRPSCTRTCGLAAADENDGDRTAVAVELAAAPAAPALLAWPGIW